MLKGRTSIKVSRLEHVSVHNPHPRYSRAGNWLSVFTGSIVTTLCGNDLRREYILSQVGSV